MGKKVEGSFATSYWAERRHCHDVILTSVCRTIYEKLSGVVPQDQRVVYTQRVEEITPNVRYCAYNIGGLPTDITQLMKLRRDAPGFDMLASKIDVSTLTSNCGFCVVLCFFYSKCFLC